VQLLTHGKFLRTLIDSIFIDRLVSFVVFTLNPFHIGNLREIVGAFGVRSGYNHPLEDWLARPA
jgi:hypothetical protein